MSIIYLACPYTHDSAKVMHMRYLKVTEAAARISEKGYSVFSPITLGHILANFPGASVPTDWERWAELDKRIISVCDELWVFCLPGWRASRGVREECDYAAELGVDTRFIDPDNLPC